MKQALRLDIIEKMFQPISSNRILFDALKMFIPTKKEIGRFFVTVILSIIPTYFIATSYDTVSIFRDSVEIMNNVILALFGIVFTGYALFQALIGKEMLVRMLQSTVVVGNEEKSKLQESNELFAKTMMMEFICIIIDIFLLLILFCIPEDFTAFSQKTWNDIAAGSGMFVYFYMSFVVLIEIKSFIFNIFELFNFHAGTRIMEAIKEDE